MSILVDFGIFGVLYLLPIALILGRSVLTYRKLSFGPFIGKELIISLWAAAAVFLVEAATFETRLFPIINLLFWLTLGLLKVVEEMSRDGRTS